MDWPAWSPVYGEILREFGYDRAADERARDELDLLLAGKPEADLAALARALAGREAVLAGPALDSPDLLPEGAPLLVTDGAAGLVLPRRDALAVVTDLDGDVAAQAAANARGTPLVVHAHGDNLDALRRHVPRLEGPLVGTTQAPPRGRVRLFGGFTDGDRAACLAVALGATSLALAGYDFERPVSKPGLDERAKRAKLAWARRIIGRLGVPVRHL